MIILFSLLSSAFFSGMEIAYVSSNRVNLEIEKNQSGLIPKTLSIITQNPSRFIATMLIGNNFALVIYGIFMGQFIFDNMPYINLASLNELSALLIQTTISTFVILIAAEFIPKVIFQIYSNLFMKIFAIPAYVFYQLFYPITSLVTIISSFILKRFFKVNDISSENSFSKLELENYIESEIENSNENLDTEIEIFQNALELSEIKARDIMVPRAEVIAIDELTDLIKVKEILIQTGLSKIPVYKDSIDNIIGYLHSFDFLKKPDNLKDFILPIEFIPEPMIVNDVLKRLTRQRNSIAVVIDEYGGTSGIITLEDVIEEIFCELSDEFDEEDNLFSKLDENTYVFDSKINLQDFYRAINLKDTSSFDQVSSEIETLGGLLIEKIKKIPRVGQIIYHDNYKFIIEIVDNKRIKQVKLILPK